MIPTTILHYHSPLAMSRGLKQLYRDGFDPRGLLFLALDGQGDVHLALAEHPDDVPRLKVGTKLSLPWPFAGRYYYVDAVHPLGREVAVVNGDRRIGALSSLVDVAALVSGFVRLSGDKSVFFGCTPHQPGSWWVHDEEVVALHERGLVEILPTPTGLLARRTVDDGLYYLPTVEVKPSGAQPWQKVFSSPLGNVLMLERRLIGDHLVLSCQGGLVEVDVGALPKVREMARIALTAGYAVVGRITDGPFAVTRGEPKDWGFDGLRPATLVGSEGCSLADVGRMLHEGPLE